MSGRKVATGRGQRALAIGVLVAGMAALAPISDAGAASGGGGPSGVVTIAQPLTSIGDPVLFDPTLAHTAQVQDPWQMAVYGSLLRPTPGGGFLPELATSATIASPQSIAVTLRPGVVFSDGTPFNADAVKAGIMRNRDAPQLGSLSTLLMDISGIDVLSPTRLTIDLSSPVAGAFYPLLAGQETFIPSPAAVANGNLNTAPVGAGPFVLQQNVANERVVLARNPKYWDAKDIHIAQLQFINVTTAPQQVSALESGQANISPISVGDAAALRGSGSFRVGAASAQTQSLWMPVCKTTAPLSNLRVRQALNYAINRNAINRAVLGGLGEPQWALWPANSIFYPKNLTGYYAYNPSKARALLAAAGYKNGFSTEILVSPGSPVDSQAVAIVQAEWKQIGVNLSIVQTTNIVGDLYQRKVAPLGLLPEVRGGIQALTGPFEPGTIGDLCNYDNPSLDALTSQLSALSPSAPSAVGLWRQAQNYVVTNALAVWIAFAPYVYAHSTKVSGVQYLTQFANPIPYYWSLRVGT